MKTELNADHVLADFMCDNCQATSEEIPVQETIYNGPPYCTKCENEMSLQKIYLNKN